MENEKMRGNESGRRSRRVEVRKNNREKEKKKEDKEEEGKGGGGEERREGRRTLKLGQVIYPRTLKYLV